MTPVSVPWYRGLWWRIWFALVAAVLGYSIIAGLFMRYVIVPRWESQREAAMAERRHQEESFHRQLDLLREQRRQQIELWRYTTPPGTPLPSFEALRPPAPPRGGPPDDRRSPSDNWRRELVPWGWFVIMALVLALATYPVARRLTRRLERLQKGVEAFGRGNLKVQVPAQGQDEVAALSVSFNESARQIESLMQQHKQLLAQASHELRTPLARLRLTAEAASVKSPALAADLRTDISELDELVGEILLASRLDAVPNLLQMTSFDALALAAEEAARTGAEVEGRSIEVEADETLVRRALRNLLVNAARYAPQSTPEVLVTRETDPATHRDQVCFAVLDRGPGISDDHRHHIFEPFYRVPEAAPGGTGLGLSLVQQIAQRHGGSVRCLPRDGGGTRFELRIPVRSQPTPTEVMRDA